MRSFEGRWSRHLLRPVLLAGLALFCGCQTTTKSLFTADGPGWNVQQGQALWRPGHGMPEIAGDLVFAHDQEGRRLLQFDKTPMSMVAAQTTSNRWLIQFPPRQMSFSGHGPGPVRFLWLYLPAALANEKLPPVLHFERKPDGGWRFENTHTGETLEGFLAP